MILKLETGVANTDHTEYYIVPENDLIEFVLNEGLSYLDQFAMQRALANASYYNIFPKEDDDEIESDNTDQLVIYSDLISGTWEAYNANIHDVNEDTNWITL